jgi:hypothetical protein
MYIVSFYGSEVTNLVWDVLSFLVYVEASIMQFSSSAIVLDFTVYTRDFMSPKIVIKRN